jgi:hypothetical protein
VDRYTGWQYLLIDAANNFGKDKELFGPRIQWAEENLDRLEELAKDAENYPRFMKSVMAIRKAQRGLPTGHLVGFDACCSGIQIMSAITGCEAGANATGMIDPNRRADAYSDCTLEMNAILGGVLNVSRKDAKNALMTAMYASRRQPKIIFGEDTPELAAFYQAVQVICPGAWELLQDLLASWQPWALKHAWKLPDGYDAVVKVMRKIEDEPRNRIEVDELDHATFTYIWYENEGSEKGLSNVANVIHSIDAYVLRCLIRLCNYDWKLITYVNSVVEEELLSRTFQGATPVVERDERLDYYISQYNRSQMPDIVIAQHLTEFNVGQLDTKHLQQLRTIMESMLAYKPFEIVSIHDEFQCHANNMNHLRQQYINVFAMLAESEILADILGQLHGCTGKYPKRSKNLAQKIRGSNYMLS